MRGKKRKEAAKRATDIKDQAKEVAGQGGEALKEFASSTGVAAKEFAGKASDAAKEFVETIEKAAKNAGAEEEHHRGRRFLKLTLAVGAGIAVFSNDKARNAIKSVLGRNSRTPEPPEIWRPESVNGGSASKPTPTTTDTPL